MYFWRVIGNDTADSCDSRSILFIVKKAEIRFTQKSAVITGVCLFLVFTLIPFLISGEVIMNALFGAVVGYGSYYIAYYKNDANEAPPAAPDNDAGEERKQD